MKHMISLFTVMGGLALFSGCASPVLGLVDEGLKPCPDKPNCVCSMDDRENHHITPLTYHGERKEAFDLLKGVVSSMERSEMITETENYLHVEFRTRIMRFVDDVEFWLPKDAPVVHVRSASRLGYSDMGVNKKRVEHIRTLFIEKQKVK